MRADEHGRLLTPHVLERGHHGWAELGADVRAELLHRLRHGPAGAVGAITRERVERVGDENDARRQRDVLALEPSG